jgi:hypothetical protein
MDVNKLVDCADVATASQTERRVARIAGMRNESENGGARRSPFSNSSSRLDHEHECSTTSDCSTSINSPAPVRSLRPLGSWTVGVCGPDWGPPSFLEAAVACHTPEEWLPVEWLVPAEQTARNPLHKCRSGCTGSAWTSPTPPHPQAGGSQTRSSPLGGRCVGFPGWYRCRCRGLSGHQHSPWTIISSPDRPDHAVVSLF